MSVRIRFADMPQEELFSASLACSGCGMAVAVGTKVLLFTVRVCELGVTPKIEVNVSEVGMGMRVPTVPPPDPTLRFTVIVADVYPDDEETLRMAW